MFASDAAPVIIYGAGEAGSYLSSKLQTHPEDNLRPVAFIDDDPLLKNKNYPFAPKILKSQLKETENML